MLNVLDINIQYGDRILLNDISFTAKPNEKIGLAGRNGAGKSTILKVIAGVTTADKGKISFPNGYSIGYLHQDIKINEDKTVINETLTAFDQLNAIEARLEEINVDLETRTDYESDSYMDILEEMATLNDHLSHMGDMSQAQAKSERILKGLGFKHSEMDKPVAQLSGGWKMRVELAKLLLSEVDLLLLDEPTNHLDIESIVWFENYLKTYSGTLILISHDVRLLDNVTTRTIEVELGKIFDYKANYTNYLLQRAERRALLQSAYTNQQKNIKEKERVIERFRAKASKAKLAQSMMKQLNRMDRIELDDANVKGMRIKFPTPPRSGDDVLEIKQLSKSYDEVVFQGANLSVKRGERIAFVGQNGQGKTTLAKIIVDVVKATSGELKLGHNVEIGYFAQDQDKNLTQENTLLKTMENASPPDMRTKLRSILGGFLFSGDDVEKKVMVLSGGERMRLALALLLLKPMNLLVMDEPTNHLDMTSKEILKKALIDYEGTLIVVSHDRDFLDGLTDRTIEFRDGVLKEYLGDINYFLEKRAVDDFRSIEERSKVAKKEKEEKPKLDANEAHRLKKEVQKYESKIEKLELKIKGLEAEMAEPSFYDCADSADTIKKHGELKAQLQQAMNNWEASLAKL